MADAENYTAPPAQPGWTCPNCAEVNPQNQPCACGMRPPVPPPASFNLPQVEVSRIRVPFSDVFMLALKVGLAMIPVGFIVVLAYMALAGLLGAGLFGSIGLLGGGGHVGTVAP